MTQAQMFQSMLGVFAVLVVVLGFFGLCWERRQYAARGKAGSWGVVRLFLLPIAALTAAVVWFPATQVSGMEGLAALYVLAVTAGPLVWFGAHLLLGRMVDPPLSSSERWSLAWAPLAFMAVIAFAAPTLQTLAWSVIYTLVPR